MHDSIRPQGTGQTAAIAGRWSRLRFSPLGAFLDLLATWQERARQRYHLQQLDDRALRDIGFSRADIEAECIKPFWRV